MGYDYRSQKHGIDRTLPQKLGAMALISAGGGSIVNSPVGLFRPKRQDREVSS